MEGSSDVEGDLVGEVFEYLLSGKYCDGASKERKRTIRKKALKFSVSSRGELFYRQKRKGKEITFCSGLSPFTLTPINITVCSGSTVLFVCSATDVTSVSYSLNSKPIPPLPPNVYISAPTVIGGATIVNMSISNASANAVITCYAYLVNGTVLTRAAYLTVQDIWGPPPDAQSPSLLSYAVMIRNGSGAPVYSEIMMEPQLVITTRDPCGHYEATLTPMFGIITGVQTSPVELEICSGSTVQFVCSATDVTTVSYSLNSKPIPPLPPNVYISAPTFIGEMRIVNLSTSNASANAVITCHAYLVNGTVLTRTAYLIVQGPPSAPTDLNIITYNDTATLLVWGPPSDAQSPSLLSYAVMIRNGSGAPVYSETVRKPQLVITTPDPCGHYEATVTPMCGSIAGVQTSPIKLGDIPASFLNNAIITSISHLLSPSDNVTVNITLPFSSKVCYYKMVALYADDMLSFSSVTPLPSLYKDQPTITVSLPPNKHFNLTITAYNGYGNTSTTVVISAFDVGVLVNISSPMGLVCLFNTGSLARGCI
ncbi:hypothetical protein EMCRGX_G017552 [Ephydatia muelleri]